jgi:large subunit ribosomal protein L24
VGNTGREAKGAERGKEMSRVKSRIKKDDTVQVISGKFSGERGKVLRVIPEKKLIFIEKVNFVKRHTRPSSAHRQGGIIEREGSLHLSNVMLVCPKCGVPVRVGSRVLEDGSKVRYCKKCDEILDR